MALATRNSNTDWKACGSRDSYSIYKRHRRPQGSKASQMNIKGEILIDLLSLDGRSIATTAISKPRSSLQHYNNASCIHILVETNSDSQACNLQHHHRGPSIKCQPAYHAITLQGCHKMIPKSAQFLKSWADKNVRFFVPLYTDGTDKINISGEYDEKGSTRIRLLMQLLRSPRGKEEQWG